VRMCESELVLQPLEDLFGGRDGFTRALDGWRLTSVGRICA
jgi:hypothetical protein